MPTVEEQGQQRSFQRVITVNGYWDFLGRDGRSLHRRWRLFSAGGTSTLVGNLIGLAVYDAVAEGVRLEQEASGKSLGSAAARSVMLVLTSVPSSSR